jgi:hypothetical protein
MCTWTNESLQLPKTNSICSLLLAGYLPSSFQHPLIWRNQTRSLRRANPNRAEMS